MIPLLIKASLTIIVFLAFYKILLEKESFFTANRFYLLSCLLFAATLPFIGLPKLVQHQGLVTTFLESFRNNDPADSEAVLSPAEPFSVDEGFMASNIIETASKNAAIPPARSISSAPSDRLVAPQKQIDKINTKRLKTEEGFTFWLMLCYGFGVLVLTLKLLLQLAHIVRKIYNHEDKIADEGGILLNMHGNIDPCSFFKYIFINPANYDYETYEQIIAHEKIHVRQWHTVDLLLAEVAVALFWFNPFIWILRKEVEKNIEFQTDDLMVRKNAAAKESYQLNLVKIATYTEPLTVTTNYNQSLIRKRILRINTKRSNPYNYLKYAFIVPTLFGLSLLLNEPARGNENFSATLDAPTALLSEISAANANQFHSTQDTLILQMEKHPGYGPFSGGFGPLHLEAIPENDDRRTRIPTGITDLKFGQEYIDFKVFHYNNLKKDQHEYLGTFLEKWYPEKIDTADLPSLADNTVKVVTGIKDGEKIFIVDQNNNLDFRDDPVRLLKNINWKAIGEPVKFQYRTYNGQELVQDSSWVFVGQVNDDRVLISAAQHLRSTFSLEERDFTVSVFNDAPSARWCFEDPLISITAQNGMQKDSLGFKDKFELGAFLQFGESYYQFADVANDGSTITLVREMDISDNIGLQVGLMAPDFSAVTTAGDPITLADSRNRYLLLANVAAICWSPQKTYGYLQKIWDNYHSKMDIVGIEYASSDLQKVTEKLNLNGNFVVSNDNPDIKASYRDFHCSKICFLIDQSGRIMEKFEIADWEQSLAKHFN